MRQLECIQDLDVRSVLATQRERANLRLLELTEPLSLDSSDRAVLERAQLGNVIAALDKQLGPLEIRRAELGSRIGDPLDLCAARGAFEHAPFTTGRENATVRNEVCPDTIADPAGWIRRALSASSSGHAASRDPVRGPFV